MVVMDLHNVEVEGGDEVHSWNPNSDKDFLSNQKNAKQVKV